MSEPAEPAEPRHGFDDSRRLTGPNRWYPGTAVTLTPLGPAAQDAAAHAGWALRVQDICSRLGWPETRPRVLPDTREPLLVFAAPEDRLFTATEISEWAWEHSSAEAGHALQDAGYDLAQDLGDRDPLQVFAARAAAEQKPALAALKAAATARALPLLADDETVSIGAGEGSRSWPLAALPAPEAVPWAVLHDIPTALVTGSNGKTTTVRLLAAIAQAAGRTAGCSSTEGVFVGGQLHDGGDYSGPAGARAVLRHPAVQLAVLETARGGLLRRGLTVHRADAAAVTNISADHLGEYGVGSLEDIAHTKLVVAHALVAEAGSGRGGTLVLNGADAVLMAVAETTPAVQTLRAAGRLALFAQDHEHPALAALRRAGGSSCGVRAGRLVATSAGRETDFGPVAELPLTLGGAAPHNTENIAAAVLLARALGLPDAAIAQTLQHFGAQPQDNPGRLERWTHRGATVLIDYAHNPDGLAQLLGVARALMQTSTHSAAARLGLLLGQAGNRDDAAITELAHTAARFRPDQTVVKELPGMLRGRQPGEVPALIVQVLQAAGLPCTQQDDEETAARTLLAWARPGDVVVLPVHTGAVRAALADLLRG